MKKSGLRKSQLLSAVLSASLLANAAPLAVFAAAPVYKDGIYTGSAEGRNGDITVSVTVKDGAISAIDVTDQQETPSFWENAQDVIPQIIAANQTDGVDAVSGATLSSEGIKKAVDCALANAVDSGYFAGGSGTASDPYLIQNASQLAEFASHVDGGENYLGQCIALDADIDLSDAGNWNPIGAEGAASANLNQIFAGTFDGRGHIIKGMTIQTDTPYAEETNIGLFSTLSSTAKVTGIRLEDVRIQVSGEKVVRAGGITGDITSKTVSDADSIAVVDDCRVAGSLSAKTDAAMVMTGGIAGRAAGNAVISNCSSDADVHSSCGSNIAYGAGIVSMSGNDTYLINCINKGDITVQTATGFSLYAGGIAGMMTSELYNCFSMGNVTVGTIAKADAANCAGLLVGALMPAASGTYAYYAEGSEMFYTDESATASSIEAVSHGAGSMHAEGTFTPVPITKAQYSSGEFADILNENLYAVSRLLKEQNTGLKCWKVSDAGVPELSDETFINDVIDDSLFASGNGSAESPYQISTADQLRAFAGSLSEHIDYSGKFIELSEDIDLSGAEWTPIGDSSYPFNGCFDGKGHTISGMTIGSTEQAKALHDDEIYLGLFSVLETNAVVRNVNLTNVCINVSYGASAHRSCNPGRDQRSEGEFCSVSVQRQL